MPSPQLTAPQRRALRVLIALTTPQRLALRVHVHTSSTKYYKNEGLQVSGTTPGLVRARCLSWVEESRPGKGVLVTPLGYEVAGLVADIEAKDPEPGSPGEDPWTEGVTTGATSLPPTLREIADAIEAEVNRRKSKARSDSGRGVKNAAMWSSKVFSLDLVESMDGMFSIEGVVKGPRRTIKFYLGGIGGRAEVLRAAIPDIPRTVTSYELDNS